jgi:hypothetical protein
MVAVAAEYAGVRSTPLEDIVQKARQPLGEDTVGLSFGGEA